MKKGQVMIEAIIAIGIAMTAVFGLVQLATKSVSNSGIAKRQSAATGYAVAANEWIKGRMNEIGWTGFEAAYGNGDYCFTGTALNSGGRCGVSGTEYDREVTLTYSNVNTGGNTVRQVRVDTAVYWNDNSRELSARESVIFTKR